MKYKLTDNVVLWYSYVTIEDMIVLEDTPKMICQYYVKMDQI